MVLGLTPLTVDSSTPFSSVSVNLISGLPLSSGFDSVIVMVDHSLMKGVIFFPCTKEINAAGVASLFFCHIFLQFGLHSKVISDHGPQFASTFTRELVHLLQYDVSLSTAYHPQTDGDSEKVNQELETYLRLFTLNKLEEWLSLLLMGEFSHNSATHSITQQTLFSLMMRYEPCTYPPLSKTFLLNLEKQIANLSTACNDAEATHKVSQQKLKEWIFKVLLMESRRYGMAGDDQSPYGRTKEAPDKENWTIQSQGGSVLYSLLSPYHILVGDSPSLPCLSPDFLQGDCRTWTQLPMTATRPCRWRKGV